MTTIYQVAARAADRAQGFSCTACSSTGFCFSQTGYGEVHRRMEGT